MLKKILSIGTHDVLLQSKIRTIQLANAIALIASALFLLLEVYLFSKNGWSTVVQVGFFTIVAFLSTIILNSLQQFNLSRVLISLIIPIAIPLATFLSRINLIGTYNYFRSPEIYLILVSCSIIPLLLFSLKEKVNLIFGLSSNAIVLFSFDFFFYQFSNAQQQMPYTFVRFISAHVIIFIMFLFICGSVTFLKNLFERFERKNERLITQLNKKNTILHSINVELIDLNKNMEAQNEEIQSQSEELLQSQESLILANCEIERQKKELEENNQLLKATLGKRDFDLLQTNHQLINQNNDLQQFSFTVSHNLRAPVASMQGLFNLYHLSSSPTEREELLQLIEESTHSLDTVIQDLNKIVDVRHNCFDSLEIVNLNEEVERIKQSLNSFIYSNNVTINTSFELPTILTIKPYLNSILFNLISNAIQYRSPSREPVISLSSRQSDDHIVVEVTDNGMGIDLARYGNDLFKLYKRFHSHTTGKGMGLFLVRQQLEKLNAKIEVDSAPNFGTTFRIYHRINPVAIQYYER